MAGYQQQDAHEFLCFALEMVAAADGALGLSACVARLPACVRVYVECRWGTARPQLVRVCCRLQV